MEKFMRKVLVIILYLGLSGICFADENATEPKDPVEISITNEERLLIQNFQLQIQNLQLQLDSFIKQLVAKYKIEPQGWTYDLANGKFIKAIPKP